MSQYTRDYICGHCYLLWSAVWVPEEGRPKCPACGTGSPHATDTFGCFYWEQSMAKEHGDDFFAKNYWWVPSLVTPDLARRLETKPYRKAESLNDECTPDITVGPGRAL